MEQTHLVLIDGHHLMYRAYWAIPRTMKTSTGEQMNAVFGVASMLLQILSKEKPDALLFCFDEGDETFRHQEYQEYKAGRSETPDDFYTQIPRIFACVDAFGFKRVSLKTHEADDLLCSYARAAEKENWRVTIITGDRDAFQLATDKTRIAIPAKGYQMPQYLDPAGIEKTYGVTPAQIPSYKGLVGDPSDNLKGVNGIGPKAASALLQKYGTLESLYEHLDEVKPAWREKLEKDRDSAFFCLRMATLICDIALPLPLDDVRIQNMKLDGAFAFCREIETTLIANRLRSLLQGDYGRAHFTTDAALPEERKPSSVSKQEIVSPQLSLL